MLHKNFYNYNQLVHDTFSNFSEYEYYCDHKHPVSMYTNALKSQINSIKVRYKNISLMTTDAINQLKDNLNRIIELHSRECSKLASISSTTIMDIDNNEVIELLCEMEHK